MAGNRKRNYESTYPPQAWQEFHKPVTNVWSQKRQFWSLHWEFTSARPELPNSRFMAKLLAHALFVKVLDIMCILWVCPSPTRCLSKSDNLIKWLHEPLSAFRRPMSPYPQPSEHRRFDWQTRAMRTRRRVPNPPTGTVYSSAVQAYLEPSKTSRMCVYCRHAILSRGFKYL